MSKILYCASTESHLASFHTPYIEALRADGHEVYTLARGEGCDFNIPFEKKIFSKKNKECRAIIRDILSLESFDLIVLNTSLAAFHVRLALGRHRRERVVNIVHGYLFPVSHCGVKEWLKNKALCFAEILLRKRTDVILTMNSADESIARRHRLARDGIISTLGMGIPTPSNAAEAPISYKDRFVLLFVGELSGRKNQRFLIEALPELKREIPEILLLLAGDGDDMDSLFALAAELDVSDSLKLLGRCDNIRELLSATDIYVSASKIEGLPFNIAEALSLGKTIVASDIKGQQDMLSCGAGYLYSPGDKQEFCNIILDIYSGKLPRISEQVATEAYLKYSFNKVFADTYEKIKKAGAL